MNNSWKTATQTSPGFVYFTNSPPTPQKTDTADFLSFSSDKEQTPTKRHFSPRSYSSPHHKQQWGSPRNNYQGRHKNRYSNSPNKTYNSSYNHTNSGTGKQHNMNKGDKGFNKNAYLHPSFTENPWAQLEAKLKEMKAKSEESSESEGSDGDNSSDTNT